MEIAAKQDVCKDEASLEAGLETRLQGREAMEILAQNTSRQASRLGLWKLEQNNVYHKEGVHLETRKHGPPQYI